MCFSYPTTRLCGRSRLCNARLDERIDGVEPVERLYVTVDNGFICDPQEIMASLRQRWFRPGMTPLDIAWHTNCDVLEEYGRMYGTCNCPYSAICILPPDCQQIKIGEWLSRQRRTHRNAKVGHTQERLLRLQALVDKGLLNWHMVSNSPTS